VTVEEIKDTYSMSDIVERYGFQPNRRGFIPCPFHEGDRQASLKVYDRDFHCHACGANGDIFTFVQKMDDLSFKEAYQSLGGNYSTQSQADRVRILQKKKEREIVRREERIFKKWLLHKLFEVCKLLRMYDELEEIHEPFSDEWTLVINKKQLLEEDYRILVSGTRKEQEELRSLE
jgi:DNA primase